MAIEVFSRYEHKYIIDGELLHQIYSVLKERMVADAYSSDLHPYTISNIYYDTDEDYLIRHSLSKPLYKEKLRLRSYGVPQVHGKVFLEIKKKFDGLVNKRRTELSIDEAVSFIETGTKPLIKDYMNPQVMREIEYFIKIYKPKPKVFLAYDRVAFFDKGDTDLRISFDENIRSRRYDLDLSKGDYGDLILDKDLYVMEVKTNFAKPMWLTEILSELEVKRRSFSKYGTEFKNHVNRETILI